MVVLNLMGFLGLMGPERPQRPKRPQKNQEIKKRPKRPRRPMSHVIFDEKRIHFAISTQYQDILKKKHACLKYIICKYFDVLKFCLVANINF